MSNLAVLIPHYNHSEFIGLVLDQLSKLNLPIIIVDDGSDPQHLSALKNGIEGQANVTLLESIYNQGKGSAICRGARYAFERSFDYIICVDADGQHTLDDIPLFIEEINSSSGALILGVPKFDSSAPLVRRLGREISNLLVWLETRSFQIRDSLCGFRAYPLRSFIEVIDSFDISPRMGFDVEILIRMSWKGVPIKRVETRVAYPADGRSHYRYLEDNLSYIKLHAGYLTLSLFPKGLRDRSATRGSEWYRISERGNAFTLRLLLALYRLLGPILFAPIIFLVSCYLFITGSEARAGAIDYQMRLNRYKNVYASRSRLYLNAFLQFISFGHAIVRKVESWIELPCVHKIQWHGHEDVRRYLTAGVGCVFVGAHFGNIERLRSLAEDHTVKINAMMFTKNARKFQALLNRVNPQSILRMIEVSSINPALILDLQEKVAHGEFVALLADRVLVNSPGKLKRVRFLGDDADFPVGPWILCWLLKAPIFTIFSRTSEDGQTIASFERLSLDGEFEGNRDNVINRWISNYVMRLEREVTSSPREWYNFYRFWG